MEFEETPLGVFSSSPGSIYPALKNLEAQGLARRSSGRAAPYRLTPAGRAALKDWLRAPVAYDDVRRRFDILMLKLAFMPGLVSARDVHGFLDSLATHLDAFLAEILPYLHKKDMPGWSRMALEQGVAVARAQLRWARRARDAVAKEIKEKAA